MDIFYLHFLASQSAILFLVFPLAQVLFPSRSSLSAYVTHACKNFDVYIYIHDYDKIVCSFLLSIYLFTF